MRLNSSSSWPPRASSAFRSAMSSPIRITATLAIVHRRLVPVSVGRVGAGLVCIGVVEGVERPARRDHDPKPRAQRQVSKAELHPVPYRVPEEAHLDCAAPPL